MPSPQTRILQLALIGVAVLFFAALILVIAGVDSFDFRSGRPLEYSLTPTGGGSGSDEAAGWRAFTVLMRVLLTIGVVAVLFQILVNKRFRIYYLVLILIFGGILLLAEFAGCDRDQPAAIEEPETIETMAPPERLEPDEPPLEAPTATGVQYVLVAVVLATALVIAGGLLFLRWLRSRQAGETPAVADVLETLSAAARRIRAGEDPYTVVLFCYQEMLRILSVAGRIDATYLTPREFQRRLQQTGLSGEHVAQLTEMFEAVRYAGRVDASFVERALACLDAIQEADVADA